MKTMSVGRGEFLQEEKPVNIDTVTEGFPGNEHGKKLLLKKLAHEFHVAIVNGRFPCIAGITYSIVKKGDRLVLKPW